MTLPSRISLFSRASPISSQPFMASTRRLESMMVPSWSLVFIMSRSISSPIFTTSSGFTLGSLESSAAGMKPACLRPTSTYTSVGEMPTTTPCTFSSVLKFLRDSSSISSKFISLLFTSAMVTSTSFIMLAGVEAPAVMPMREPAGKAGSSSALSTRYVSQCSPQISRSFAVLELSLPPTTTIIVAPAGQGFSLFLPFRSCITYCSKNSGVCTYFFQGFQTNLPFARVKCGLGGHCYRAFWAHSG